MKDKPMTRSRIRTALMGSATTSEKKGRRKANWAEQSRLHKKPTRDPDIDQVQAILSNMTVADVYNNSYLSRSCIRNLKKNKTRKPQHMSMVGMLASAGYEYQIRRKKDD